jgi:hypothetical protein
MLLGALIRNLEDETTAMETLVSLGDLALLTEVETAAAREALTPGAFASRAVAHFANTASDDDWVSLVGKLGRTDDPGSACLAAMLAFALTPRQASACGHSHHG